ncbi:hypothetical protein CQW23_25921 [Capsicum baccatum]|uniref:Uncharacterized protein n=1 Tax=Capsicum baccatum TaxID=33114 RepID=A0A2G2VMA7_CAPBA|nr:hypothetical protein CQW23_25921 [Capsicum baccatum]
MEKSIAPSKRSVKNNIVATGIVQKSIIPSRAVVYEDETEDEIEDEDKQPLLRPRPLSEAKIRLKMKISQQNPTSTREINFLGDDHGFSMSTNLSYSPKKMTWKDKSCVTSSKLLYDLERNNGTPYFYTLDDKKKCSISQIDVGVLSPNWLHGATYFGQ